MRWPGAALTAPAVADTCRGGVDMAHDTCAVQGCPKAPVTRGWCRAHYERWRRNGDPLGGRVKRPAIERLAERLDRSGPGDCWIYTGGASTRSGHRQIWSDGKMVLAHRVAYEAAHGRIPDGLCVCHACDNPPCCNPDHLWLGTVADNNADRDRKGRQVSSGGRAPLPADRPINHGTLSAYTRRGCRCEECSSVNREYHRARRERLRAAGMQALGSPVVELPAAQVDALSKVEWPRLVREVEE